MPTENLPADQSDLGMTTIDPSTGEIAVARQSTEVMAEIQGAMVLAKKFPRNYDSVWNAIKLVCARQRFAEEALYSFPRGGAKIEGPSVNMARELAKLFGNLRCGLSILNDDGHTLTIEGYCWDLETNAKVAVQDRFQKLIFRKGKGWIIPDERDLRELTMRRGAVLVRNAIFGIVPKDFIEDAVEWVKETLNSDGSKDWQSWKKKVLAYFDEEGVTLEQMSRYVDKDSQEWGPNEIRILWGVKKALSDGAGSLEHYFPKVTGDEPGDSGDKPQANGKSKAAQINEAIDKSMNGQTEPEPQPQTTAPPAEKEDDTPSGDNSGTQEGETSHKSQEQPKQAQKSGSGSDTRIKRLMAYPKPKLVKLANAQMVEIFGRDVERGEGFLLQRVDKELLADADITHDKNTKTQLANVITALWDKAS